MPPGDLAPTDSLDRDIVQAARALAETWGEFDTDRWPHARQTALTLLVWSGWRKSGLT